MDEIDSIAKIDSIQRKAFLSQIISIKQSWRNGVSPFCLFSTLIITNWTGYYLTDLIGESSFDVSETIYLDYFTYNEFNNLWKQYEDQEKQSVDIKIKNYMFEISEGLPGIVSILGNYYNMQNNNKKKNNEKEENLSFEEWLLEMNSYSFWSYIELYQIFSEISKVLEDYKTMKILLMFIGEGNLNNITTINLVKDKFIKSNIWRMINGKISFSSRFIKIYIDIKSRKTLIKPQKLPLKSIQLENGKEIHRVDISKFVETVVEYMNPSIIISGEEKINYTDQSRNAHKGPSEIVYINEFNDTIRLIFPSYLIK